MMNKQLLQTLKRPLFFDGGLGTMLQARGLRPGESPELWGMAHRAEMLQIHAAYRHSGADIITTNTFGCHVCKLPDNTDVGAVVRAAVENARAAADGALVALDVGPTGKLLQPCGSLSFEDAVASFATLVRAGAAAGAELILIETMSDLHEAKAALLAAKENASLPVLISFTFSQNGRLFGGADAACCAMLAEALGADAVGINCGFGPEQALPILCQMRENTTLPLFVNANAGLPQTRDGATVYDVLPDAFVRHAEALLENGAVMLGGCCGTTPEYIRLLSETLRDRALPTVPRPAPTMRVCSGSEAVRLGDAPVIIGERLNPTGKPALKKALAAYDENYILREAVSQVDHGADILDVNVGLPGLDEPTVMRKTVSLLQGVVATPLSVDTTNPAAAEAALRVYNGVPLLNSVCGKQSAMDALFPLIRKYGAVAVALTLDEDGVPDSAEGRVAIAERILREAARYGISPERLLFDPLTMAISTGGQQAEITLDALRMLHRKGLHCVLGVSNVSFGLPNRTLLNSVFLSRALQCGLNAAICNPNSDAMTGTVRAFAALAALDKNAERYIAFAADTPQADATTPAQTQDSVKGAICHGLSAQAVALATEALTRTDPIVLIREELTPALEQVGRDFESGRIFLPQLMNCAECARAVFETCSARMPQGSSTRGQICLATVHGDVHDIGKNIVRMVLESYGYRILDLGRDVPPQTVLDAVRDNGIRLLGLSALMTTTTAAMAETIRTVRAGAPDCRIMVGGAVLTAAYAAEIGADDYCRDAMDNVRVAQAVFGA